MSETYISREAAIKELCVGRVQGANTIRLKLNAIPAAEVVPVVRCKDCRYFEDMRHYTGLGWCEEVGDTRSKDWFCADGERREANDER